MLGTDHRGPMGAAGGIDLPRVARAFRERVLPCGVETVNRLEEAVLAKLAEVRGLETIPEERFAAAFRSATEGVLSARSRSGAIARDSRPAEVREILRGTRVGEFLPIDLPTLADRLAGAPREVRLDVTSELMHAAAPDRIALLSRWVWNPARRTGILGEFGGPPPETYAGTQARLAEVRLALDALGFPSATFAAVDVLLALTYAGRLGEAVDRSFQGGGIERLLPGAFPLATMVLGVRRRLLDADR